MKGPLPNTYIRQKDKKNEKPRNTPSHTAQSVGQKLYSVNII